MFEVIPGSTKRLRQLTVLTGAALLTLAPACKKEKPLPCPRFVASPRLAPSAGDPVVAEVNGRPILGSEVAHRARQEGLERRAALEALIDDELLVQEAERRGLARDPEVVMAAKQAAVYALLRGGFEKEFTPSSVKDSELRKLYKLNERTHFRRPELRRFSHILANRPWVRAGRKWRLDKEADDRLRALFEKLHAEIVAAKPQTWREFEALKDRVKDPAFPKGTERGTTPKSSLQRPFSDVLFALKQPGDLSPVILTQRHIHIAFLVKIIPPTNISYEQARGDILARQWPEAQSNAFKELVREAKARCTIVLRPEHLPVGPAIDPGAPAPSPAAPRRAAAGSTMTMDAPHPD